MNRTLRFGEGLFESFIWKGENEKVFLHYRRLRTSAEFFGIPCPDYEDFITAVKGEATANPEKPYVKVLLLSEGDGRYWEPADGYSLLVETHPRPEVPSKVSLCFSTYRRHSQDPVCRHKTTSYLFNVLVRREARDRGFYDGIILNEKGQVTECSSSNILIVKGEDLITPSEKGGLLMGTTLSYLSRKLPVEEKCIRPEDLLESDGVFILNSLIGIVPVESVEGKAIPFSREVFERLSSAVEDIL